MICIDAELHGIARRLVVLAREANSLSHNETTWEKKHEAIELALETVLEVLESGKEIDIEEKDSMLQEAIELAERALTVA